MVAKKGASKKHQAMTKRHQQNGGFLPLLTALAPIAIDLLGKAFSGKGITKRSQRRV